MISKHPITVFLFLAFIKDIKVNMLNDNQNG